jgi:hypothetical protein
MSRLPNADRGEAAALMLGTSAHHWTITDAATILSQKRARIESQVRQSSFLSTVKSLTSQRENTYKV